MFDPTGTNNRINPADFTHGRRETPSQTTKRTHHNKTKPPKPYLKTPQKVPPVEHAHRLTSMLAAFLSTIRRMMQPDHLVVFSIVTLTVSPISYLSLIDSGIVITQLPPERRTLAGNLSCIIPIHPFTNALANLRFMRTIWV